MTNVVVLRGRLTRPVGEKVLPSGDHLAVLDITIPAAVQADGTTGRAESVPASWFGPPAWLLELDAGAELVLVGRVRRRFFHSSGLQSRTEVVVEAGVPARRVAKVAQLVARAVERLTGTDTDGCAPGKGTIPRRRLKAPPTFP